MTKATHKLNAASLEGSAKPECLRPVRIVERYEFDGARRLGVELLTGPEKGRIVRGISVQNLRHRRTGEWLTSKQQMAA